MSDAAEIVEPEDSTSDLFSAPEQVQTKLFDDPRGGLHRNLSAQQSIGKKRGRRPKWWTAAMFHLSPGRGKHSTEMLKTCNGCSWQTRAQRPKAIHLGLHLLGCDATSPELQQKLLKEEPLRRRYNNKRLDGELIISVLPKVSDENILKPTPTSGEPFGTTLREVSRQNSISTAQVGSHIVSTYVDGEHGEAEVAFSEETTYRKGVKLLTKAIASGVLPLSILDRTTGDDLFFQLVKLLNPVFTESVPTCQQMIEKNLVDYFDAERKRVKSAIKTFLNRSFGTIILHGQTKSNGTSIVNVLLAITGQSRVRRTFFLRSFFIGCGGLASDLQESLVQDTFREYGDMKSISGIVSANTSSCMEAKLHAKKNHDHLLSCYDQVHVAQLLLRDMGKLPWIREVLSRVFRLFSDLFLHTALYNHLKMIKDEFDEELSKRDDSRNVKLPPVHLDELGRVKLPLTSNLPEQIIPIPFLSASTVLQSFLTYRKVFKKLIKTPEFFSGRNRTSAKRLFFIQTVTDESFYLRALDVYHIFRLIRQYMRLFDDECSVLSEVYPATMQLRKKLSELPTTLYYTKERRSEVIEVLDNRLNGIDGKTPLLTSLHRAAYLLDIRSAMDNLANENNHLLAHITHFVKSNCSPEELKSTGDRGQREAVRLLYEEYQSLRRFWTRELQDEKLNFTKCYSGIPVMYWLSYRKNPSLREFALRVLSTSPSSTSIIRNRSLHERISFSLRSKHDEDRLQRRIFCSWNEALCRQRSRKYADLDSSSYSIVRADTCFGENGTGPSKRFSKFFDDEHVSSIFESYELQSCSLETGECGICCAMEPG